MFILPHERSSGGGYIGITLSVRLSVQIRSPWEDVSCNVHDLDLWPQGQIYSVYDMALCTGHSFFGLWHSHTMFCTWGYHRATMCCVHSWPLYDIDLWTPYQNYIFKMNLSLARLSLLFDIGISNFGIWVYHHEATCCVHSWPFYDLDLWPICG